MTGPHTLSDIMSYMSPGVHYIVTTPGIMYHDGLECHDTDTLHPTYHVKHLE